MPRSCFCGHLAVCWFVKLLERFWTDFGEMFRISWQCHKEQVTRFWWSSGPPPGSRNFFIIALKGQYWRYWCSCYLFTLLFIWCFNFLPCIPVCTTYMLTGKWKGGGNQYIQLAKGSVQWTADRRQATTSFSTWVHTRIQTLISEVGGECVTTAPPWPSMKNEKKYDKTFLRMKARILFLSMQRNNVSSLVILYPRNFWKTGVNIWGII